MRVDRLLGEHGIKADTAAGREEFERQMEKRRMEETDERELKALKRDWFLGSQEFRAKLLERMEPHLGEHHSGRLRHESAEAKAERIIAEELRCATWKGDYPYKRPEGRRVKVAIPFPLGPETTLTIREIAQRPNKG